jgi:uncharacterized Zn finger protein
VQQGMMLKAYCYSSLPEPFRVQVTFDGSGITASLCSCSGGTPAYGNRGCEHAAALLLAWNEQPEAFTQMDDIDTILERQSKAQLIALIKQLLQKQPEVEWQLTMPPLPGHKSVPIDTEEYRRQVDAAFRHGGREWDAVYGISSDLYSITETAARFARQRDYTNAAAIYEVVAMGTLSHYLSYHDEDGALGRVVQACVEGLGACLESEREDAILRERILEAIFAVYRFDVNHGGFGLTKDIPPEFLQGTTPEEKHLIAQWVRTALKAAERTEEAYPRASIDLYQQHVERLIAGRGRSNYQVACSYLAKIRSLYEKLDETGQWTTYIAWLRKWHSRLSTLKQELVDAGL